MDAEIYYMICFDSSQRAIQLEKALSAEFDNIRLVPIPPEIKASCGLGIKVSPENFDLMKNLVNQEQIYLVTRQGSRRTVERCKMT